MTFAMGGIPHAGPRQYMSCNVIIWGFPGGTEVKNPPVNARSTKDASSILDQEDPPEKETAASSSIFSWKIPCTALPGRLESLGSQRGRRD